MTISPEVDAVARSKVDLVFKNVIADGLDVGQVPGSDAFKCCRHLHGGLNIECAQPFGEGTRPVFVDVLANVKHRSMITYTSALLGNPQFDGIRPRLMANPFASFFQEPRQGERCGYIIA